MSARALRPWLLVAICLRAPGALAGDDDEPSDDQPPAAAEIDDTTDAGEAEFREPPSQRTTWNELNLRYLTLRIGGGVLVDLASYEQDAASAQQMNLSWAVKLRDLRLLFKGKLTFAPRVSYTLGYMWDAPDRRWRFRQTGIMVDVPEIDGNLFVGRTKEGFSTNKLMVGYFGWTIERSAASEAFLPILADGLKWSGNLIGNKVAYNLGWFIDTLSENESFNKNDKQFAARVVYQPFAGTRSTTVLHLATEFRYGASDDGFLQYKSRPEAFPAQSFAVDTGKFLASSSTMMGFEAYYRPGPLMFGSEYYLNRVSSDVTLNPFFHGGEVFASYIFTGEVHPYDERGAYFEGVVPSHPITSNGPGAWELVMRFSYLDLDSGTISGGRFTRITPVVSWYASINARVELEYGYSWLDRMGLVGHTQYLQARLQLSL